MTDTAIPLPDDAADRMARQAQAALDVFTRAWEPVIRDVERGAQAAGRIYQQQMSMVARNLTARWKAAEQRHRVHRMMPALTMRQTLVHGYVPYEET